MESVCGGDFSENDAMCAAAMTGAGLVVAAAFGAFSGGNVFLTKEDILSAPMTIKDLFSCQAMNIYDFGKINIMPNGDAYANLNHPSLGNIYKCSLYEITQKEVEEGISWFRIRNQKPCTDCVYQWLCPTPSNYEIIIDRSNICHMKN